MKTPHARTFLFLLVLPLVLGYTFEEDDLVFDDLGEDTNTASTSTTVERHHNNKKEERKTNHQHKKASSPLFWNVNKKHLVQRLEGIKETSALVGKAFKFRIPKNAFSGSIDHYEIYGTNGHRLPKWLNWDEGASTLSGIPGKSDVGEHKLHVKAIGKHRDLVKDIFTIRVLSKPHRSECDERDELIEIILDATFDNLKPLMKIGAIENLAGYLGMHMNSLSMYSTSSKDSTKPEVRIISSGPGNVEHRKGEHVVIGWQVGCDGRLWRRQADIVKDIMEQAKDGRLAEVLQISVMHWRLMVDSSLYLRNRRDVGSGDYNTPEDYDNYDEVYEDYEEEDEDDESESITESSVPRISSDKKDKDNSSPEHPHRHHHGEESIDWNMEQIDEHNIVPIVDQNVLESSPNNSISSIPSTVVTTTTQLTSPSTTSTTTIMSSTSTTTTTSTTTAPSITSPTTIITTTSTTSTTKAVPTVTSTTADTISSMTETTDIVEERTGQEQPGTESDTIVSESTTVSIPYVTVIHSSTPNIIDSTTELDLTTVINNATTKEPSPQFGNASSETTTNSTTSTIPVTIATTNVAETILPSSTNDDLTTSSGTFNPVTINNNLSTIVPIMTTVTTPNTPSSISSVSSTIPPSTLGATSTIPTITTTPTTPVSSPTPSTIITTVIPTWPPPTTTTTTTTTTVQPRRIATESIHNTPPKQNRRLRKIPVTAGKLLSYVIPSDTFSDSEDGNTRKLKLRIHSDGEPLKRNHWLQFNPQTHEIYGLPLEKEVSTWDYELIASDSEGLNVSDRLDIHVQQHKSSRTVNHEFVIYLQIDKPSAFASDVDWEIKVLKDLATLYGDQDVRHITAREISIDKDQAIFVWTNDSIPRSSECPVEHINQLARILTEDKGEIPSERLLRLLTPEIKVKRIHYRGFGQCQGLIGPVTVKITTQKTKVNFPPVPRNQVDHINATVGKLLVFKVPEDTFFDHEDGSSRNMKMDLFTMDRAPIPGNEWLQFDTNNQEFYGIPMHKDIGRKEYQLIVTDKDGATATDGLVVIVNPAPVTEYSLEFWATLLLPYNQFIHSASLKRNFVQKLQTLFHDKDTNAISLYNITEGSTVIVWHNTTIPTSYCAHDEINRLQSILVNSRSRGVAERVHKVMGDQFPINQVSVVPMGICADERTGVHSPDNQPPPVDDSTSIGTSPDSYLLTIILPTIIIAAMILLAGIIACILYRRRRSGKMSVSEQDDERQSFRSKGIPVIFQDELDEKPDPGNKSPVILKEEKPPLPPPEYQKSEDGADVPMLSKENSEEPYQPPPPFATNRDTNRQNRPKPTPTYRKPPPYVPP